MKYGFGVDVGGTTVKLGLLSEAGELLEKWELPTRTENGGEDILPDIARSVQDCMARRGLSRDDCLGLGIGVPGPVDASGMVNRCVNLNWGVFNLHDALGILTGLRVRAGNDANCAALGEFWMGGGSGCRSAIFVTLGNGHRRRCHRGRPPAHGRARRRRRAWPYRDQCAGQGPLHLRQTWLRRAVCLGERHRPRDEKSALPNRPSRPACARWSTLPARTCSTPPAAATPSRSKRLSRCSTIWARHWQTPAASATRSASSSAAACPARATTCCAASSAISAHMFHACKDTQFALATLGNDAGMYGAFRLLG